MDWESWLHSAAKSPSDSEDERAQNTENEVRAALRASAALKGRWKTYVKGSYANNTNVRLNYDVDIAVEYIGHFYSDLVLDLKGHDKSEVNVISSTDTYSRADFKRDIKAALVTAFGSDAVESGKIAYRVRKGKTTLPADVVPSWEYRRYDGIYSSGNPIVHVGSCVFPSGSSSRKVNFPELQKTNGIAKNTATGRRYKRMGRCFKKLQTYLVAQGVLDEELPSYLSECLVYNVTDTSFGHVKYVDEARLVLAQIFNATLSSGKSNDWKQVDKLRYLFRGNSDWTATQVHHVANVAWDAMGFGK